MTAFEVNFDGLVGPTHNYAGLSYGNVASLANKALVSNPKEAALQGLGKMKALSDMGLKQGILAPHERPDLETLRRLGFQGHDIEVLQAALKYSPELLASCSSASSMWTANAATVCPSVDAEDSRVHFTAANLVNKFHRSIEHRTTSRLLRSMFRHEKNFAHHDALPASDSLGDEGAANHTRLCSDYGARGLHVFVYGRSAFDSSQSALAPKRYPARQTLEASLAVARLHQIHRDSCIFVQQNPDVIDAGAFHNDVVAVGNKNVLFYHELAFVKANETVEKIKRLYENLNMTNGDSSPFQPVQVSNQDVSIADAVKSYLFNSQLISLPSNEMCLVAPQDCKENPRVNDYIQRLVSDKKSPIKKVSFFDLRQSMQNGGGPACLRLRVVLNEEELTNVNPGVILTDKIYDELVQWVEKHYRDRLELKDLADPALVNESRTALDSLTQILKLGSVYPFQINP